MTRAYVVHQAQELQRARSPSAVRPGVDGMASSYKPERFFGPDNHDGTESSAVGRNVSETTPLLGDHDIISARQSRTDLLAPIDNQVEESSQPRHTGGKAGSMNMRALVLHVMGDALGNIGVISTGLVIWLSDLSWKYYFDPIISLVITCIIFSSALPLGALSALLSTRISSQRYKCFDSEKRFFHPSSRCSLRNFFEGGGRGHP